MPVSHYFNNFSPATTGEQRLHEDLIVESIKIMGHDVWYVPRDSYDTIDSIMGENINTKFDRAYKIEMYVANVEGYEGDGDFFSKFGLELRETSSFVVARRSFERYVPSTIAAHPREGDLIYVPVFGKMFEIKFVEEELMFHSIGRRVPIVYEIRCEAFRYSQEDIFTGVEEVDQVEADNAYVMRIALGDGTGNYILGERVYQGANLEYAAATASVQYWMPGTKKLNLIDIKGAFTENVIVRGVTSNTAYDAVDVDVLLDISEYDQSDNKALEVEADLIIVSSESDPFNGAV